MEGALLDACGKLFQRRGALLEKERVPGREEGRNGRREFPLPLVRCENIVLQTGLPLFRPKSGFLAKCQRANL